WCESTSIPNGDVTDFRLGNGLDRYFGLLFRHPSGNQIIQSLTIDLRQMLFIQRAPVVFRLPLRRFLSLALLFGANPSLPGLFRPLCLILALAFSLGRIGVF